MPYQETTLAQLQTALIVDRLGNSQFYTSAEATVYINEALRVFGLMTGYWKAGKPDIVKTSASTWFYSVPAGILSVMRCEFNEIVVDQVSLEEMDRGTPDWQTDQTAAPQLNVQRWFPSGLSEVGVHPSDAFGQNDLGMLGIANAPVLVNSGDFVDLPADDVSAILDYSEHVAKWKVGGFEFSESMKLYQRFLLRCAERNARIKSTSFFKKWMGVDKGRELAPMFSPEAERASAR